MMRLYKRIGFVLLLLLLCAMCVSLTGCGETVEVDTSGMILVVYDGNGGYLGNKAATVRKLFCNVGSKIPDYPVDYTENQYTVPSLGLAMREGYQLMGWYSSADYRVSEDGDAIYLDTNEQNGVYESDASGAYVRKYVASENGDSIFIYMEEAEEASDRYIFLQADGENLLSVEPGFYVCNGESDISEIDDDALREAYRAAYAEKTYSASQTVSGWLVYADLSDSFKTLFASLERYTYTFCLATEDDEDLDHYALVSGYASINSIFVEDDAGDFTEENGNFFRVDSSTEGQRLSIDDKYVFTFDSTEDLTRYSASMHYWDFANDTVTEDVCKWDGEKYVLNLHAHWVKKNTVYYHYENGTGKVDEATKKLLPDNITYMNILSGATIGKKEIVPSKQGSTFVCWSKSADTYDPWDFENDVFPENANELHLYAYYIEGTYTRILSAGGLAEIGKNPAGNFLIVNDIDLGGKEYTASPFGLTAEKPFTGKILSFGKKITNFTLKLGASKKQATDSGEIVGVSLIPKASNATVEGLTVSCNVTVSGLSGGTASEFGKKEIRFWASGLIGTAEGECTVKDCDISLTVQSRTAKTLVSDVYTYSLKLGDLVAYAPENCHAVSCRSTVETTGLVGSVELQNVRLAEK